MTSWKKYWLAVQGASCARPVRLLLKAKLLLLTLSSNSVLSLLPDPSMGSERDLPVTGNPKRQIPIMSEPERALEMNCTFIQCVFREHLLPGSTLASGPGSQGNKD